MVDGKSSSVWSADEDAELARLQVREKNANSFNIFFFLFPHFVCFFSPPSYFLTEVTYVVGFFRREVIHRKNKAAAPPYPLGVATSPPSRNKHTPGDRD